MAAVALAEAELGSGLTVHLRTLQVVQQRSLTWFSEGSEECEATYVVNPVGGLHNEEGRSVLHWQGIQISKVTDLDWLEAHRVCLACRICVQVQVGEAWIKLTGHLGVREERSLWGSMGADGVWSLLYRKINADHGNSGIVRAKFKPNIPSQAFGKPVRVVRVLTVFRRPNPSLTAFAQRRCCTLLRYDSTRVSVLFATLCTHHLII